MIEITLFKDKDGKIQQATDSEVVTRKAIVDKIARLSDALQCWQDALAEYDKLAGTSEPEDKPADAPSNGLVGVEDEDGHIKFVKPDAPQI